MTIAVDLGRKATKQTNLSFLRRRQDYLRYKPGLDNDILQMLSFPGCLLVALELANVIVKLHQFYVKLPSTCHVGTSAYSRTSGSLF